MSTESSERSGEEVIEKKKKTVVFGFILVLHSQLLTHRVFLQSQFCQFSQLLLDILSRGKEIILCCFFSSVLHIRLSSLY